jgi:hypothetical protein
MGENFNPIERLDWAEAMERRFKSSSIDDGETATGRSGNGPVKRGHAARAAKSFVSNDLLTR